jgi:hypothetical protein
MLTRISVTVFGCAVTAALTGCGGADLESQSATASAGLSLACGTTASEPWYVGGATNQSYLTGSFVYCANQACVDGVQCDSTDPNGLTAADHQSARNQAISSCKQITYDVPTCAPGCSLNRNCVVTADFVTGPTKSVQGAFPNMIVACVYTAWANAHAIDSCVTPSPSPTPSVSPIAGS